MNVSDRAVELNADFEGFFENAYLCPAKVWTVGYGTTYLNGRPVRPGDKMTKTEAKAYMKKELQEYLQNALKYVNKEIAAKLNQNQLDSIALFTYNVGVGNFAKSSFLKLMNAGDLVGAPEKMLLWDKAKGKVLRGLQRRRKVERDLFLTPVSK